MNRLPAGTLAARESEAVRLLGMGHAGRAIAEQMGITKTTVCGHLNSVRNKMGILSYDELRRGAIEAHIQREVERRLAHTRVPQEAETIMLAVLAHRAGGSIVIREDEIEECRDMDLRFTAQEGNLVRVSVERQAVPA